MKHTIITSTLAIAIASGVILPTNTASALSCLPTEMYAESVIGDENTLIFIGTTEHRIDTKSYTAEVITVTEALQGFVESDIFVYHDKDETWGYLCNAGPGTIHSSGVYIANRDETGTYHVSQRLEEESEIVTMMTDTLEAKDITGEKYEISSLDRQNQIMTTIVDLFNRVSQLLAEYAYWRNK